MKKNIKYFIIVLILGTMFIPLSKTQATTLKEYEDAVEKYTAELQEKENQIASNEAEIEEIKQKIVSISNQIFQTETEIDNLEQEIEQSNQEIAQKGEESKSIMEYYQLANGDNAYLEYAFGAETITDMIYRASIVEQLTEYNDQIMKELEALIETNEQKTKELATKKEELAQLEKDLETEKAKIEEENAAIEETVPTVKEQIRVYQEQVDYWKAKGCTSNDILGVTCAVPPKVDTGNNGSISIDIIGANGFRLPMNKGYLTQGYSGKNGHMGVDFGSSNKSEEIYPVASGQVIYVGKDSYGANVVKIVHNVNGTLIFSTYAHMRAVYLKKGQIVTTSTLLGLMGSTGWSTGPHLHLEMTTCDWTYNCTYATYKNSLVNPLSYIPYATRWG